MNHDVLCKYIVNKDDCPYGKKCRFLHDYSADLTKSSESKGHQRDGVTERPGKLPPSLMEGDVGMNYGASLEGQDSGVDRGVVVTEPNSEAQDEDLKRGSENMSQQTTQPTASKRTCRFYIMNSRCKYGDRCRYSHPSSHQQDKPVRRERVVADGGTERQRGLPKEGGMDNGGNSKGKDSGVDSGVGVSELKSEGNDGNLERGGRSIEQRVPHRQKVQPTASEHICRFYLKTSHCKYGDRCRYVHPSLDIAAKEDERQKEQQHIVSHESSQQSSLQSNENSRPNDTTRQTSSRQNETHRQTNSRPNETSRQIRSRPNETTQQIRSRPNETSRQIRSQPNETTRQTNSQPNEPTQQIRPNETSRQIRSRPNETTRQTNSQPNETSRQSNLRPNETSLHSSSQTSEDAHQSRNPPPLTLASFISGRAHVQRPRKGNRSQKGSSMDTLREVELEQLQARFPGESCALLSKSNNQVTYRISFEPSDQDWHGPKQIQMDITFPGNYPKEHCRVELSSAQKLSVDAIACGNKEILGYWQTDMLGGLMFRPFLHWWDKNLVGILQPLLSDVGSESSSDDADGDDDADEEEEAEQMKVAVKSKKGTEMRFVGLDVSQTLGTAFWSAIKVVLSCSRCKNHQEIELKEERLYSVTCGCCSNNMRVIYHLALIHSSSATLGYLELTSCTPVDVIFQSSTLSLTCLNCNSEVTSQGFFIGQPKDSYCRRCHEKITINASGIKFVQHVQSDISGPQSGPITVIQASNRQADILLKDGQSLPDYGICQHYKKSHRWLRFPCCGRAFPCDVCHDTSQDHPMERANRMICGFCSKEQGYSGKGECVRCKADLVSSKNSTHWEGGQGCRNKVKMSRLDRHKYKNTEKTTCKKSERVGKHTQTTGVDV